MAIGFPPKHLASFPLADLSPEQFLILALETAASLNWALGYLSNTGFVAYTGKAEITVRIQEASVSIKSASQGGAMMDLGYNKKTIAAFMTTLEALKAGFSAEELAGRYEALQPALPLPEHDALLLPAPTIRSQFSDFLSIFLPSKDYFITPILLDLNIIVFLIMVATGVNIMTPDSGSLLRWGANFRPLTLEGQWWRLITCCFLHIGILHLLMNMYALGLIGAQLEPRLGRTRFLAAYLLTGIAASINSLYWHEATISAGASGAIFGMYGVFLALLTTNLIDKAARKPLLTSIGIFVAYNLLYGMKGGIDNAAHLGGLASGLLIGYAWYPSLKKPDALNLKLGSIGLLSILILGASFIIYKKLPNDIGRYDAGMKEFAATEIAALEVYKLPANIPRDSLLSAFRVKGIDNWNKGINILDGLEQLHLPAELHERNKKLKAYCSLRLDAYQLTIKTIAENTDSYKDRIDADNRQIEGIINQLRIGQENK